MRYTICGLDLHTDIEFPELQATTGATEGALLFRLSREALPDATEWFHQWELDTDPWVRLGRLASGYLVRFPDCADFLITDNGARTLCHPAEGTHADTIRHLYLDQVVPLILSQRGKLCLHASAVQVAGQAIVFAGASGSGKSTLAASFAQAGGAVIADDCVVLEEAADGFRAGAIYGGLRLWPETADQLFGGEGETRRAAHDTRKRRLAGSRAGGALLPLRRIYFLESAKGASSVEVLPATRAFLQLLRYAFRLDVTDHSRLAEEFPQFVRLANAGSPRILHIERDFLRLAELRRMVVGDIGLAI